MMLHNTLSVFRFEFRRTVTIARLGVWLLLVLFPVFIVSVMKYYEDQFDGGPLGKREDPSIRIEELGVTIDIRYRDGRREGTIRFPRGGQLEEIEGVPIPNNLSRDEIEKTYQQLADRFKARGEVTPPSPPSGVDDTVWGGVFMGLIPGVTTLLGLLLWATPVVQAELEGKTWIYLAVRPRGRASVLLGKYLTAVTWTALAGWTSVTACTLIAQPHYPWRLWSTLCVIVALACASYGALYCLIGVCIQRRAMVIAVAYTLIFEFLVSFVPAVINQFTINYRLRNLFVSFMQWRELLNADVEEVLLGNQPAWLHLVILCGSIITLLVVATTVIQNKEYATADEA